MIERMARWLKETWKREKVGGGKDGLMMGIFGLEEIGRLGFDN